MIMLIYARLYKPYQALRPQLHISTWNQRLNTFQFFSPLFTFGDPKDESIRLWIATDTVMFEAVMITQEHGWSASVSVSVESLEYCYGTQQQHLGFCMYVCSKLQQPDGSDNADGLCRVRAQKLCMLCLGLFICVKTATGQMTDEGPQGSPTKNIHKLAPDMICKRYCASKPILSPTCSTNWTSLR